MTKAPLLLVTLLALGAAASPAQAKGWEEVHQTSDDVRVTVGPDGIATVNHHLRYRIVAGRFKSFDLEGLDPRAELVPETLVVPERGGEIAARVEVNPKVAGGVRIVFDQPPPMTAREKRLGTGLRRGAYVVDVKYKLDLVAAKMLVRDGAMWKLAWTAPPSPEGHDGARVVFQLPPAPTEPRLASPEQAATTLVTSRRDAEKDELELVRAHVPRGEAVTWSARVDPKAFPLVVAPDLRPPVAALLPPPAPSRVPLVLTVSALALVGITLAFVLRAKQRAVALACDALRARPRPLVPVPWGLGPLAYGAAATAALGALLWSAPIYGAALVVLAMALAAHRTPSVIPRPRGPGLWQTIADREVLAPSPPPPAPGDALDVGTRRGKIVALVVVAVLGVLAFVLRSRVPGAAVAIPLSAAALVPLFVTGTQAQMPRRPAELAARVLAPARDTLGRLIDLAHVDVECRARFSPQSGSKSYDEVRLACAPSLRIPGLRTIELALAGLEPGAPAALPEVLVRFDDGSAAAAKIAQMAPGVSVVPGRSPEEKVLRLTPRVPTPTGAARLLARLTVDLEGHRASDRGPSPPPAWTGIERRLARLAPPSLTGAAAST
ncbi:MAG: hypothetical protein KF819_14130 [Labilithrix sp.]|nr:hypothetical protein [Labilithrix sp.]